MCIRNNLLNKQIYIIIADQAKTEVDESKYWVNFYTKTGKEKIVGQWHLIQDEADKEANSNLYANKLGYTRTDTASIARTEVEKMAKEHNMSVADILSSLGG